MQRVVVTDYTFNSLDIETRLLEPLGLRVTGSPRPTRSELIDLLADALIDEIHAAPTADRCERLLVPGEREWAHRRAALEHGLELPDDVGMTLADLASHLGIDLFAG